MAKAAKSQKPPTVDEIVEEVATLRKRKTELEERNDELRGRVEELEELNGEHVRDQLERLAADTDRSSAPQTPEQWARCLREILRGADWEAGTWR